MYKVQQVFTYDWVDMGTYDLYDEAEDAAIEIMDDERPDTVRIVEV